MQGAGFRWALCVAGVLFACAGSSVHPPAAPPREAPDDGQFAIQPASRQERQDPSLVLIDAGAAPRRELGYRFAVGAQERCEFATSIHGSMHFSAPDGSAVEEPAPGPDERVVVELSVGELDADGSPTVHWEVVESKDAAPDGNADAALTLKGLAGQLFVTDLGHVTGSRFEPTEGTAAALAELDRGARSLFVPLPAAAVGVGASWSVSSRVSLLGIKTERTQTYRLTRSDGDDIELEIEVALAAGEQRFLTPGADRYWQLEALNGSGTGRTLLSQSRACGELELDIEVGGTIVMRYAGTAVTAEIRGTGRTQTRPRPR